MGKVIDLKANAIKDFLNQDIADLKFFPDDAVRAKFTRSHKIDFTVIENETSRQQFRDLLFCIFYLQTPYSYDSKRLYHVFRLTEFMSDKNILEIPDDKLVADFKEFCLQKQHYNETVKIILTCKEALLEFYDTRKGFERDLWDEKVFTLPKERTNKSAGRTSIHFRLIENVENRELVKLYIKYLLGNTEFALSTIINIFSVITKFCNYLEDKSLLEVTEDDFKQYLEQNKDGSFDRYNKVVSRILGFYNYLFVNEMLINSIPVSRKMNNKKIDPPIENTVSEHVILQIFANLHKAPFHYMLMYLINYCTGMRVSDVCQLRTDCLYYDGNGGYYIKPYNCQKMQKPIMNLIPKSLYALIQEQIKIINNLEYEEEYLFPSKRKRNTPYQTQTFRNNFKALCHEWGIKNEDGTPYNYTTHSYRHTISCDLYQNYNVPIVTIQKAVLWHKEIQMSLHYVERPDNFKKLQEEKYISKCKETELSDWLKDNLKGHILPNGICGLSDKLGVCPAVDACLSCPHFLTSKKFLQVHKDQLATIKSRLIIYESNNWLPNIETAKRQIRELEDIISKLEETEDNDDSKTISTTI